MDIVLRDDESTTVLVAAASVVCGIDVVSGETRILCHLPTASLAAFYNGTLLVAAAFEARVFYGSVNLHEDPACDAQLSFAAAGPGIPATSPLLQDVAKQKIKKSPKRREPLAWDAFEKKDKKGDMPVTFHSRIKSSGYGVQTKRRPQQNEKPVIPRRRRRSPYPIDCGLLSLHQPQHDVSVSGPIRTISIAGDARSLAVTSSDGAVTVRKLPIARRYQSHVLLSDRYQRFAATWSFDSKWLLTTADRRVEVWASDEEEPRFSINEKRSSIAGAQFFFLDRFVILADGNSVEMHHLDTERGTAEAFKWPYEDAHNVTALAAVNTVPSPLILAALSNRCLRILDARNGDVARHMADVHTKPVTSITIPTPSTATHSVPQDRFNLFATAASDNIVKLWDLRSSSKCAASFTNHVHRRSEALNIAISPCVRYLATGSEDKLVYVYDLRSAKPLLRLRGHTDVVSAVAFNPLHPQLISGSYDSRLRFYTCPD